METEKLVLQENTVKTRKIHKCSLCGREIPKYSQMVHKEVIINGIIGSLYTCMYCRSKVQK